MISYDQLGQCDRYFIDYFYDYLDEILLFGIPSAFVINIDESGYCNWVDSNDIKMVVPLYLYLTHKNKFHCNLYLSRLKKAKRLQVILMFTCFSPYFINILCFKLIKLRRKYVSNHQLAN